MEAPSLSRGSPPSGPGGGISLPGTRAESVILKELMRKWFRLSAERKPFTCTSKHNSNSVRKQRKKFIEDAFRFYPKEVVMKFLAWAYKRHLHHYAGKHLVFYNDEKMVISPIKARFNNAYLKMLIGRFWDLHQRSVGVHMTLTASTNNYDNPLEGLEEIKKRWNRFLTALKKHLGVGEEKTLDYLMTTEPHKSGYYHLHVIIFGRRWIARQKYLLELWRGGEKSYGLHLKRVTGSKGLQYVLKYLRKGLDDGNAGLLVFSGMRQYSTSQDLVSAHISGTGEMSILTTETRSIYFYENPTGEVSPLSISAKDAAYTNIMNDAKGYDPPFIPDAMAAAEMEWEGISKIPLMYDVGYMNNPLDAEKYWRWLWY